MAALTIPVSPGRCAVRLLQSVVVAVVIDAGPHETPNR